MEEYNQSDNNLTQENRPELVSVVTENPVAASSGFWQFIGRNFLAFSILFSGLLISGALLYTNSSLKAGTANINPGVVQPGVKADVSIDDDPMMGNPNAKVTIIEFSDFQCPFCRIFWKDALAQIRKDYVDTGKVRFVYRDFPLSIHPMAESSAEAANCANDQAKYWQMHDKIFGEEDKLGQGTVIYSVDDLKKWAGEIGLNKSQFNQCLDSNKYKNEIAKDFTDGTASGVSGTPSIFINGRLIVGAQPYASFKAIIDEELKNK